jgi:hypothetical protein
LRLVTRVLVLGRVALRAVTGQPGFVGRMAALGTPADGVRVQRATPGTTDRTEERAIVGGHVSSLSEGTARAPG